MRKMPKTLREEILEYVDELPVFLTIAAVSWFLAKYLGGSEFMTAPFAIIIYSTWRKR